LKRQAGIGALLLVCVGVILGATVFRSDIAQATGLAQSVTVNNTAAQAVPVREQNLDGGNIKVHEEGTANVSVQNTVNSADADVRTAVRFGPVHLGPTGGQVTPSVPAGKTLIVTYITVHAISGGTPIIGGSCGLRVDNGQVSEAMGGIPFEANPAGGNSLAASETAFLPLQTGEGLEIACDTRGTGGTLISTFLDVTVGGYFIPAT
jgi:hypothetical protein